MKSQKNNSDKITGVCTGKNCSFRVYCGKVPHGNTFTVCKLSLDRQCLAHLG